MTDWYVVHTKSRQEGIADAHLRQQAYTIFLPYIRQARHRRGRWRTVTEPLFPGYLFVQLDLTADNAAPIRSTRGVLGLVRFNARPAAVPRAFIDELQALQGESEAVIDTQPWLTEGEYAIYDIPGLTFQGPLDDFWSEAQRPDPELFEAFRNIVIHTTQVNGGLHTQPTIKIGLEACVERLQREISPLDELFQMQTV